VNDRPLGTDSQPVHRHPIGKSTRQRMTGRSPDATAAVFDLQQPLARDADLGSTELFWGEAW
jgi:hypothetical protein